MKINRPERLVAYHNPASTHANEALEYLEYFGKESKLVGIDFKIQQTEPDQASMNESVKAVVVENDAIISASGDGGNSSVLEAALEHPIKPPVLTLPFGNGNDIASMLNNHRYHEQTPDKIFQTPVSELHPIVVKTLDPAEHETRIRAFAYFGVGVSGRMANFYSDPHTRNELDALEASSGKYKRYLKELFIAVKELYGDDQLIISNGHESREITEINFINGPRESKTTFSPNKLLSKKAAIVEIKDANLWSALNAISAAALNKVVWIDNQCEYEFKVETGVVTQKDGQTIPFKAGTKFFVRIDDEFAKVYASQNFDALSYYAHTILSKARFLGKSGIRGIKNKYFIN